MFGKCSVCVCQRGIRKLEWKVKLGQQLSEWNDDQNEYLDIRTRVDCWKKVGGWNEWKVEWRHWNSKWQTKGVNKKIIIITEWATFSVVMMCVFVKSWTELKEESDESGKMTKRRTNKKLNKGKISRS